MSKQALFHDFDNLPDDALVRPATAQEVLAVSAATLWRMAKAGRLTPYKIGLRATRFRVGDLRRLARSCQ